jgi:hypothetical protein
MRARQDRRRETHAPLQRLRCIRDMYAATCASLPTAPPPAGGASYVAYLQQILLSLYAGDEAYLQASLAAATNAGNTWSGSSPKRCWRPMPASMLGDLDFISPADQDGPVTRSGRTRPAARRAPGPRSVPDLDRTCVLSQQAKRRAGVR